MIAPSAIKKTDAFKWPLDHEDSTVSNDPFFVLCQLFFQARPLSQILQS